MNMFANLMKQPLTFEEESEVEEKSEFERETKDLTADQKLDLILSRLEALADRLSVIEDQLGCTRLDAPKRSTRADELKAVFKAIKESERKGRENY